MLELETFIADLSLNYVINALTALHGDRTVGHTHSHSGQNTHLGEFAVCEEFEQRTLAHGAVAD